MITRTWQGAGVPDALRVPPELAGAELRLKATWPPELETRLEAVKSDVGPSWYRAAYDAGELELACYGPPGAAWAWVLWRLEDSPRELVGVAAIAGAEHPGDALAPGLLEAFEDLARELGAPSIRLHTQRPGLITRAIAAGWHQSEVIMRKRLEVT